MAGWLTDPGPKGEADDEGKLHSTPPPICGCGCKQAPQDCPNRPK
jgi:hypothetical protein